MDEKKVYTTNEDFEFIKGILSKDKFKIDK